MGRGRARIYADVKKKSAFIRVNPRPIPFLWRELNNPDANVDPTWEPYLTEKLGRGPTKVLTEYGMSNLWVFTPAETEILNGGERSTIDSYVYPKP